MTTCPAAFFRVAPALSLLLLASRSISLSSAWAGSFNNRGTIHSSAVRRNKRLRASHSARLDLDGASSLMKPSPGGPATFPSLSALLLLRGGQQQPGDGDTVVTEETASLDSPRTQRQGYGARDGGSPSAETADLESATAAEALPASPLPSRISATVAAPLSAIFKSAAAFYTSQLTSRPVITKSLTAGVIFGLSDWCAQIVERRGGAAGESDDGSVVPSRVLTAFLVGTLYFGPAANAWYDWIFRLLPSKSLLSTLQKAVLGQVIFGPVFTCVFFGAGLVQGGAFTPGSWLEKIREDLPGVWASGLGFWPLVDFISYKVVPVQWIPLFVNFCSFVWTIYLSLVSNREGDRDAKE